MIYEFSGLFVIELNQYITLMLEHQRRRACVGVGADELGLRLCQAGCREAAHDRQQRWWYQQQ